MTITSNFFQPIYMDFKKQITQDEKRIGAFSERFKIMLNEAQTLKFIKHFYYENPTKLLKIDDSLQIENIENLVITIEFKEADMNIFTVYVSENMFRKPIPDEEQAIKHQEEIKSLEESISELDDEIYELTQKREILEENLEIQKKKLAELIDGGK